MFNLVLFLLSMSSGTDYWMRKYLLRRKKSKNSSLGSEELEDQRSIAKEYKIGLLPHLCGVASLFNQMSKDAKGAPCVHLLHALGFGDLVGE
jgi:hypothetical protein